MSSAYHKAFAVLAVLALLAACDREERQSRSKPIAETVSGGPMVDTLHAGQPLNPVPDPRAKEYENNAYQIAQGQQLYSAMNCVGCHAHGGGGMGPALMDDQWRYGGAMEQIVATIDQGRPNGMPAWRGKLTEAQMWQLAAYVRSLSAQPRQDALGARADEMSTGEPFTLRSRQAVTPSSPAGVQGTTP